MSWLFLVDVATATTNGNTTTTATPTSTAYVSTLTAVARGPFAPNAHDRPPEVATSRCCRNWSDVNPKMMMNSTQASADAYP